jgi:hypothetical protein
MSGGMVSRGANGLDGAGAERIEGGPCGREGTLLDDEGSAADEEELFWDENGRFGLLVALVLFISGFSNPALLDEEIEGRAVSGSDGAEDEKLEGRGVAGTEARGDGDGGTFIGDAGPRAEIGAEDEPLACCCRSGACGPDCAVLPF